MTRKQRKAALSGGITGMPEPEVLPSPAESLHKLLTKRGSRDWLLSIGSGLYRGKLALFVYVKPGFIWADIPKTHAGHKVIVKKFSPRPAQKRG